MGKKTASRYAKITHVSWQWSEWDMTKNAPAQDAVLMKCKKPYVNHEKRKKKAIALAKYKAKREALQW